MARKRGPIRACSSRYAGSKAAACGWAASRSAFFEWYAIPSRWYTFRRRNLATAQCRRKLSANGIIGGGLA
ncbi:hypothetical protein PX52LOC_03262 [Limnoglobus roseus]|uniref:Uncharacterized protein n=1 Tax=Limnoglobus roseus TaxID=2598579 RepID=A0A5C1AH83_9BACT|nr:hypothetical protein PX52LOC_03262 [Limnoglobus roseus]